MKTNAATGLIRTAQEARAAWESAARAAALLRARGESDFESVKKAKSAWDSSVKAISDAWRNNEITTAEYHSFMSR